MKREKSNEFKTILSVMNWYRSLISRGIIAKGGAAYSRYKQLESKYHSQRKY